MKLLEKSDSSNGVAAALEETAATMEEMNATIKSTANNASKASQLSSEAAGCADKGGEVGALFPTRHVVGRDEVDPSSVQVPHPSHFLHNQLSVLSTCLG